MKHLKIAILVCGLVGLVALIAPLSGRSLLVDAFASDELGAIVYAASFVLPAVAGAIALARPPMRAWHPSVALAGFVLGVVRFRIWDVALHVGDAELSVIILLAGLSLGTIASVAALLRPEVG